jgi:hypothetical protein
MKQKQLTPIQILRLRKTEVETKCELVEKELSEDFEFVQDNALPILSRGVSYVLFPKRRNNKPKLPASENRQTSPAPATLDMDYLISIGKSLLPLAWNILKPIASMWAIRKVQNYVLKLISDDKQKNN